MYLKRWLKVVECKGNTRPSGVVWWLKQERDRKVIMKKELVANLHSMSVM